MPLETEIIRRIKKFTDDRGHPPSKLCLCEESWFEISGRWPIPGGTYGYLGIPVEIVDDETRVGDASNVVVGPLLNIIPIPA